MDRRATYLWAWLAVLAQVIFGIAPTGGFAGTLAPRAAACCETTVTNAPMSCCDPSASCEDCACCAAPAPSRETPRPSEPSRDQTQLFAIWPATRSFITSSPVGGAQRDGSAADSRGPTRERIGFLASRLRV